MTLALLLLLLGPQQACCRGNLACAALPAGARRVPDRCACAAASRRTSTGPNLRWSAPACRGPDGRGLRVRFAGTLGGRRIRGRIRGAGTCRRRLRARRAGQRHVCSMAPASGSTAPQGDSRCQFDEVEQQPLGDGALRPRSFRISARGFCVAPARALDGEGLGAPDALRLRRAHRIARG